MEASVPILMLYNKYNTGVLKHSEPEFPVFFGYAFIKVAAYLCSYIQEKTMEIS